MFDRKKLEAFLDSLEVETHFPTVMSQKMNEAVRSVLEQKMDKYDIFRQPGYENVGTPEFPVWAKPDYGAITLARLQSAYAYMTYGMAVRAPMGPVFWGTDAADPEKYPTPPRETPHDRFKKKAALFQDVAPVKLENPEPAPPRTHRSPDYVGTITAWRGWSLYNGLLGALGSDFAWPGKTAARAHCSRSSHDAPQMNCACGFWSFKTQELMIEAMSNYLTEVDVIGTVEIWGRVIECENGYRSEYAYPKELWLLKEGQESLSWTYGVPVRKLT